MLDNIAHTGCNANLLQLSSNMLIIEIERKTGTEWLTRMEEKLFDEETNVL